MLGVFLGLLSSVSWGVSDFLGGLQARRISAFSVLLVSQPFGLLLAFAVAFVAGDEGLPAREAAIAAAAGMIVVIALGAFYRAMALGSVSVVATIGALGIMVPFIGGLAQGESPGRSSRSGGGGTPGAPPTRRGARGGGRPGEAPSSPRWASARSSCWSTRPPSTTRRGRSRRPAPAA